MGTRVITHFELEVYKKALDATMKLFELSKSFPKEEKYSLTDQLRRASRSVSANLAEAWRKRRYQNHFVSKLSDAEGEAAETQTWIQIAVKCEYLDRERGVELHQAYEEVLKMIVAMIHNSSDWIIPKS